MKQNTTSDQEQHGLPPQVGSFLQGAIRAGRQLKKRAGFVKKRLVQQISASAIGKKYAGWKGRLSHYWLFPCVFLWSELLLRLFNGTTLYAHFIYLLLFSLSVGLVCAGATSLFSRKLNRRITIVLLAATALFFTVECMVRNAYKTYMTISTIIGGAGGVVGEFGGNVISSVVGGFGIILLFFLPLLLYLTIGKKHMPARRYQPLFSGALLILAICLGGLGSFMAGHFASVSDLYAAQYEYSTATEAFGLLASSRLSLQYSLFGNAAADEFVLVTLKAEEEATAAAEEEAAAAEAEAEEEEEIDYGYNVMDIDFDTLIASTSSEKIISLHEYVSSLEPSSKNEYTGLFEGKNLIIITAEAFSSQVINEELTPTLYRMATQGIQFTDFYQPAWGGSTSTGEYSILLGLVPTNSAQSMVDTIGCNLYFTMGNQLQRLSYTSIAFHNANYSFYKRNLTHKNLGYDEYYGFGNGLEDIVEYWSGDKDTLTGTLEAYLDQQPFNLYYMTYSGHSTYTADSVKTTRNLETVKAVLGDTYEDTTLYYFCYQLELEYALEGVLEILEENGIADDTVIVICTDHYPYGLAESSSFGTDADYLLDLYQVDDYDKFIRDSSALIIWSGCIEGENIVVDTPTMSLDILPTLSNLFGLEYDSRLLVGRDVFSDAMALCIWTDYSWVTEKGKYNAATGVWTPAEGVTVDDDYISTIKSIVSNKISFSTKVIDYDYYGILFGDDDVT